MKTLFKGAAGTWPNLTGNANLVPVVAKGQVLVASHNQLEIFGFTAAVTTTTLASSPNPSPYGGRVSITATVHSTTTGTPTGTVTFQEGATTLGTATMSSGKATFTISTLSLGTHSITAVYSGDANFVTSGSPALVQTVIQSATSTTVTSAPNPSQFNQSVVLSAKVSSATEAAPTAGVFVTVMPRCVAAIRSTLSVPVPRMEIIFSRGACANASSSKDVYARTLMMTSAEASRLNNSARSIARVVWSVTFPYGPRR